MITSSFPCTWKAAFFHVRGFVQLEPFKVCTEALPADRCGDLPDAAGTDHAPFLQVNRVHPVIQWIQINFQKQIMHSDL